MNKKENILPQLIRFLANHSSSCSSLAKILYVCLMMNVFFFLIGFFKKCYFEIHSYFKIPSANKKRGPLLLRWSSLLLRISPISKLPFFFKLIPVTHVDSRN